jgi:hypothetical protein
MPSAVLETNWPECWATVAEHPQVKGHRYLFVMMHGGFPRKEQATCNWLEMIRRTISTRRCRA